METHTRVTDPYFGTYYRLYTMPGVVWNLGPCAKRVLRTGYLWNSRQITQTGDANEKMCRHRGVHGTIDGTVTYSTYHTSPFTNDYYEFTQNVGGGFIYTYKMYLFVDEGRSSATVTARVERTTTYRGKPYPSADRWAQKVLSFAKSTDPYTGNVSFAYSGLISSAGTYVMGPPHAVEIACPYGKAHDELGPSLTDARYWLDKTLALRTVDRAGACAARDEAIYKALDSLQVTDFSWSENFQDALTPLDSLRKLARAFSSGNWWVRAVKMLSNLHLFWEFCIKNGITDAAEIQRLIHFLRRGVRLDGRGPFADMIGRGTSTLSRSGDSWSEEQVWHAKVVLSPGWGPFSTLSELQLLGILPTAGSIWDLVPFSFVVDWLIPVGTMLSRGEDLLATMHCPLKHIVVSQKATITYAKSWHSPDGHDLQVNLTEVRYNRDILHSFPMTGLGQISFRDPRKHALTGLALVVQQLFK